MVMGAGTVELVAAAAGGCAVHVEVLVLVLWCGRMYSAARAGRAGHWCGGGGLDNGDGNRGAAYGAACQAAEVIMIMMDSKVVEAFKLEVEQVAPEFVAVALAAEPA